MDIHKSHVSASSEELEVDLMGGKDVEADGLFPENSVVIDRLQENVNQLTRKGSISLPDDFEYKNSESPYDKLHSRALEPDYDQERMPSPLKVEDCQGEMDELNGRYLNKLSSMANDSHTEKRTEDSTHSQESPVREEDNPTEKTNGNVDLDIRTSPSEEKLNMLQEMSVQEEGELKDENYDPINSPTVSGRIPERVGENSVSPERASKRHKSYSGDGTLSLQGDIHKVSNPPSSPRHRESMTHERSSRYRPEESSSPKRSDQNTYLPRSRPKDGSSRIRRSSSPQSHDSPRKYGRLRRSVSRSPVRRSDTSSRYKRDRSHRSRSRSPYKRDRGISPRGRHSPRRRSPPTYHSSRHSPRSRPWAPPPNRRTGLGKPGNILFVAGFNFLTTEEDLKRKFSRFGRVRDVRIVRDKRSGDSRGFGFLSLERDEDADAAIKALDETEWNGRIILVEKSKSH
ncbi:Glycine-rich RNA-binding protein [Euphorbia peplus]|nr:Glycine-rich RNA-binding protein [Euphorbia peplus]